MSPWYMYVVVGTIVVAVTGLAWWFTGVAPVSTNPLPTPTTLSTENTLLPPPPHLRTAFTRTDWSRRDDRIAAAVSGGPPRDGIPALADPTFIPLTESSIPDDVTALVFTTASTVRVYPYNILMWHEIVNDTIDGFPVVITFCPLCGTAIVYDRTLPDGQVAEFGVSGSLLESNLIMFDRSSESLWQQSTGQALAGQYYATELTLLPFNLLPLSVIRDQYPKAQILSENTGHNRDYRRNPYSDYDEHDDVLFFPVGESDDRFSAKTIMLVFAADEERVAVPWLALRAHGSTTTTIGAQTFTITTTPAGSVTITDHTGAVIPSYFEMWFSYIAQHGTGARVIDLK